MFSLNSVRSPLESLLGSNKLEANKYLCVHVHVRACVCLCVEYGENENMNGTDNMNMNTANRVNS